MKFGIAAIAAIGLASSTQAIQPGQWQTTGRVVDVDITMPPGVPAGMADMMKKQMTRQSHDIKQCISREDIEQAPERMFKQSNGDCEYERFDMSGGKLDAVAVCRMQGTTMRMTMTGTHTDTTYQTRMVMTGDGPMGPMTLTSDGSGTRIGDC
ncbi:MAG: DUF3617 domain-containing protein [Pacificimonas sp.]